MTIGIAAISDRPLGEQYQRGNGQELIIMAADRHVTFGAESDRVERCPCAKDEPKMIIRRDSVIRPTTSASPAVGERGYIRHSGSARRLSFQAPSA